jgi:glycosyltransferase involved in cell wall biosynthesis
MPDLAVIMSVYKFDRFSFVQESVQSILNQTFTQFDYYIIFDGPVSSEIKEYITSIADERVRIFQMDKNMGLAAALNYLLELILKNDEYKFIARMDADDVSVLNRYEKQYKFLIKNPDISVVGCWYEEIDEAGKHLSYRKLPTEHEELRKRYYTRTPFAHPSIMYRRELIEKAGFYPTDTVLMEDNVLWGRALKSGLRFSNLPEYLLKFRIDEMYYQRRSGIKYGWKYIKTRFKTGMLLSFPLYVFPISFLTGIVKMMPAFMVKYALMILNKL